MLKAFLLPLISILIALSAPCFAEDSLLWIPYKDLRPTQFTIGYFEVKYKATAFAKKSSKKKEKYFRKKPIQAVIAPNEQFYIIDGHHTATSFVKSDVIELPVNVIQDFSTSFEMDMADFWQEMKNRKWVYLYNNGKKRSHKSLPKTIDNLEDDPFRSVAWFVRKAKAFKNLNIPFQEFAWANYFREKLPNANFQSSEDYFKVIRKSIKLIKENEPTHLPGYKELTKKKLRKCLSALEKLKNP